MKAANKATWTDTFGRRHDYEFSRAVFLADAFVYTRQIYYPNGALEATWGGIVAERDVDGLLAFWKSEAPPAKEPV